MAGVVVPQGQRKGLLDTVMQGLQIASSVYGIKANAAQLEAHEQNQEARKQALDDERQGVVSVEKAADLGKTHDFVAEGTQGAQEIGIRKGGDVEMAFIMPRTEKGRTPLQKITVPGPNGTPMTKFVAAKEGDTYPEYVTPKQDKTPEQTMTLRKEYEDHPVTKKTYSLASDFNKIQDTASRPDPNGAGDISLVYSFMRMNDPTSTVREGEFATAENAGGVPSRISSLYNKMLNGERLPPEMRKQFVDQARTLYTAQLKSQQQIDARYSAIAKKFGQDPQYVVNSDFQAIGHEISRASQPPQQSAETRPQLAPTKSGYMPGSIVKVNGVQYKIEADGDTLTPVTMVGAK